MDRSSRGLHCYRHDPSVLQSKSHPPTAPRLFAYERMTTETTTRLTRMKTKTGQRVSEMVERVGTDNIIHQYASGVKFIRKEWTRGLYNERGSGDACENPPPIAVS